MSRSSFVFGARALATAEGNALVVRAPDGEFATRWEKRFEVEIEALALAGAWLVVLDASGTATLFDLETGHPHRAVDVGRGATHLAAADDGAFVAAGPEGISLVRASQAESDAGADVVAMDMRGATALAMRAARLAIGGRDGAVRVVDARAARAVGSFRAGTAVRGLAACPRGRWIAAVAHAILDIERDGGDAFQLVDTRELELGDVACDPSGALVAVQIGERKIALFDRIEGKLRGNVAYAAATSGLAFDGLRLGIGLAGGSFDVIDLEGGMGLEGRALELRLKHDEIGDLIRRAQAGEGPSPELKQRAAAASGPKPTPGAILAIIGFTALALVLIWLLRSS